MNKINPSFSERLHARDVIRAGGSELKGITETEVVGILRQSSPPRSDSVGKRQWDAAQKADKIVREKVYLSRDNGCC